MSDIGINSATNTNDFGGGVNTFTTDLRDLGNEKLLIIIYKKMRAKISNTAVYSSMGWNLHIVAHPDRRCTITYKSMMWTLPWDLNKIFGDLLTALPRDTTEVVYEKIQDEIEDAMNSIWVEPYTLPIEEELHPIVTPRERIFTPMERDENGYYIWNYDRATAYDTAYSPVIAWASSYENPNVWYITSEDFETKRANWELSHNTMYLVFNQ